jgi:hypothetical protein
MNWRYLSNHWDGCMCEACDGVFTDHNPNRTGPLCSCSGCRTRGAAIRNQRQTTTQYNNQGRTKAVATVNFCERCNTMGKSSAMGRLYFVANLSGESAGKELEICPGCVADAFAFLKWEDGQAERPKSYSEPYSERQDDPLAGLSDDELARAYLARVAAQEGLKELGSGDGTV